MSGGISAGSPSPRSMGDLAPRPLVQDCTAQDFPITRILASWHLVDEGEVMYKVCWASTMVPTAHLTDYLSGTIGGRCLRSWVACEYQRGKDTVIEWDDDWVFARSISDLKSIADFEKDVLQGMTSRCAIDDFTIGDERGRYDICLQRGIIETNIVVVEGKIYEVNSAKVD